MKPVIQEEKKIESEVESLIDRNRVVSFSDAVFAFAATLLVLKIDLPEISGGDLNTQLAQGLITLWPAYLANVISFLVIGYYWLNHHAIFGFVQRFNQTIVWINLIFLISISFLPFPVDLYGDYSTVPIIVVFYSASLAFVGYFLAFIWWYAADKHRLINKNLGDRQIRYYLARILIAPIVFTFSIPLVWVHPIIAQGAWVLVLIGTVLINRIFHIKNLNSIEKATF
ncbi:MAG: TMEM175 family protein [Patescibacteria group bacterium]